MLKIGDFSKLAHVTVKTLRHYARLGLLQPAWTDRFSGYRYYTLEQLPRLNRILALKDLGFSLDQIHRLLKDNLPVEQIRGMLRLKQTEVEEHILVQQHRLVMVEARLEQIERAGQAVSSAVLVKQVEATPLVVTREIVPSVERLPQHLNQMVLELNAWMAAHHVAYTGPWMALYQESEYREHDIPVELGLVVGTEVLKRPELLAGGKISLRRLPAVAEMASLVHGGPVETLAQTYTELYAWMEAARSVPAGPPRELYFRDNQPDGRVSQVIEVQIPVERPSAQLTQVRKEQESTMDIRFVNKPAFSVVGLAYHGNNANNEIAQLWGEFNQKVGQLPDTCEATYGVCDMIPGLPEGHFEYVASYPLEEGQPVPAGLVVRHIPAHRFAVFAHRGGFEGLRQTYHNIYQVWMPEAGLKPISGMDMEVYTEEFDDFSPKSVFYIYVPVE
jgi:predicted transcriptional regulator YdeE/DNA-binding transcriptional MerR regulator